MSVPMLARFVSILGHPALLMPLSVALSAWLRGAPVAVLRVSSLAAVGVAVVVGLYSLWQVRSGRWLHLDASVPAERWHLNLFLSILLLGGAMLSAATGQPPVLAAGLSASAAIVLAAIAGRRRGKASLHCAFAAFGTTLLWPVLPAMLPATALALAVGWSRLRLGRHTLGEVVAGLVLGAAVGAALQSVFAFLP